MKGKRKRMASILCFFKPKTNDDVEKDTVLINGEALPENRRRQRSFDRFSFRSKSLTPKSTVGVVKNAKESNRRILSKIMSSISSDSPNWGGKLLKLVKRKESGNKSFMKASASLDYKTTFSVSSKTSCSSYQSVMSSSALCSPARKRPALPSPEEWNYKYTTVVHFLLLSFCDLVFCGRVCSILWTAMWLSFVPQRRNLKIADVSAVAMLRRAEEAGGDHVERFLERNREDFRVDIKLV